MSSKKLAKKTGDLSGGNPSSLLQECFACGVLVVDARKRIAACTAEAAEHLAIWRDAGGTHGTIDSMNKGFGANIDAHIAYLAEVKRRLG